jgi:hypothetical protein
MIRKIITNFILILFFFIIIILITLSTIGIETDRFNKFISNKINQTKNIKLELMTVRFKLDLKELSLFIETKKPKINYNNLSIPSDSIKVYVDFLSLIKTDLKIKKINLVSNELDIIKLNKLSKLIKPSNFKNFLNNKIYEGKLISEIEIFFNNSSKINSYIIKGKVKNLKANIFNDLSIRETNFSFFADEEVILIKNIYGTMDGIKIFDGDVKFNLEKGTKLVSNFDTEIDLNYKIFNKYNKLLNKYNLENKFKSLAGEFSNNITVDFDNTYKLLNYNYNLSGKIKKSNFLFAKNIKNDLIPNEIKEISFIETQIQANLSPTNLKIGGKGKYSINNSNFLDFKIENNFSNNLLKINGNFDYKNDLNLNFINYKKPKDKIASLFFEIEKEKKYINLNKLIYNDENSSIKLVGVKLKDYDLISLKKIDIQTLNNNFSIQWKKKILIKGTKFDATYLPKYLSKQNGNNILNKISKKIEIDIKTIKTPVSEKIKNLRLIGEIQKGKFVKLSSKGDFGENNFLDISMKTDKENNRRYLEIYSDLSRPLLTEYNFFKGLSGGKLLFTSLIEGKKSNSKLRIEKFKVVNAPGVVKLLSLADLGGLADLAEGEGISFDLLEINMEKNKNFLKLNEILALGPSMSVIMEGYQDEAGITSLKGTLVPAKTLNTIISKIPVIGNIVIPKEVGEGLFGISFKMKGPKGKIKTTINPIKTITPRFIQKIIERNKESR